ncbi:MAG: hypothetical protein LBR29_06285, partial [Methylobacteriaceae bacterium]|nr:hypothetical protein [Methylobacteriaceae bacterium]
MVSIVRAVAALLILAAVPGARAQSVPGFSRPITEGQTRLTDATWNGDTYLAGLVIDPGPGAWTYWRHPGEAGLAPDFDWGASLNLKSAEVLWPVPEKMSEAHAFTVNAYRSQVLLPVILTPVDKTKPVQVNLTARVGICSGLCSLVEENQVVVLRPEQSVNPDGPALNAAVAALPKRRAVGADGPLSIVSVERTAATDPEVGLTVTVRAEGAAAPELFIAPPPGWYINSAAPPASEGALHRFAVVLEHPEDWAVTSPSPAVTLLA